MQIGADVGGTFTDVVVHNHEDHRIVISKAFSTQSNPAEGIKEATESALAEMAGDWSSVAAICHGTTIATNALLERRGAKAALVVTLGFRDILFVGRQTRPSLYDLRARRPQPVVPRDLTFELDERTTWLGTIEQSVDPDDVAGLAAQLARKEVEAIAVCFLHAYANPENERMVRDVLVELMPKAIVAISSDVCPQLGEYERATTTAINAYVSPPLARYLTGWNHQLASSSARVYTMQSNGGAMTTKTAASRAVHTLLSGPAGGLIGARHIAGIAGIRNAITLDVGGTSADVGLIVDGSVEEAPRAEIAGFPVRIPFLDIHTVGAGGGSVAWVDSAGALRVGPQSAGANPGPICYGRGGAEPTVTDAHVVLGAISGGTKLGGHAKLDADAAVDGVTSRIADRFGVTATEAAAAIIDVANTTMARAIRVLTVERGLTPAEFALLVFGGAGPLHAASLASVLGIEKVIVPPYAGVLSALGMLTSNIRHDFVETHIALAATLKKADVVDTFRTLEQRALAVMANEGFSPEDVAFDYWVEMQYVGQGHQIPVRFTDMGPFEEPAIRLPELFHEAHRDRYGFAFSGEPIEVIDYGLSAIGRLDGLQLVGDPELPGRTRQPSTEKRSVWFSGELEEAAVFRREDVGPGAMIRGPAVIESDDTTILVPPKASGSVDTFKILTIDL